MMNNIWFKKFIRACRKYKFMFILSNYCELSLILRPINTFESVELKERYCCYRVIFKRAIKEMKNYRKNKIERSG